MFEAFCEMDHTPFARDLPTDQLYDSSMMQKILGRLKYTAERQLFAALSAVLERRRQSVSLWTNQKRNPNSYSYVLLKL
ncbi:hypothetical protein ACFVHQ_12250 [Actinomycetes bacterium NPDC127524]